MGKKAKMYLKRYLILKAFLPVTYIGSFKIQFDLLLFCDRLMSMEIEKFPAKKSFLTFLTKSSE